MVGILFAWLPVIKSKYLYRSKKITLDLTFIAFMYFDQRKSYTEKKLQIADKLG